MIGILRQARPALVVAALLSSVVIAFAQQGPMRTDINATARWSSVTCWERHWKVWTLIEELGELPQFEDHRLSEALLESMRAHRLCADGRETEALSVYDGITHGLVTARLGR